GGRGPRVADRAQRGEGAIEGCAELRRRDAEARRHPGLVGDAMKHAAPAERSLPARRDAEERPDEARWLGSDRALALGGRPGVVDALALGIIGVEADDEPAVGPLPRRGEILD